MMRAILAFAMAATPLAAAAQETCDVRSTVEAVGNAVVFRQLEFCGDADPVTTLTCTPGKATIRANLPVGDNAKGKGETQIVSMEIGGNMLKRRLRVTSETTSETTLDAADPLRAALLSPGTEIAIAADGFSTRIGVHPKSAGSLADWKVQCGFE
jgi:hypothetical protein